MKTKKRSSPQFQKDWVPKFEKERSSPEFRTKDQKKVFIVVLNGWSPRIWFKTKKQKSLLAPPDQIQEIVKVQIQNSGGMDADRDPPVV